MSRNILSEPLLRHAEEPKNFLVHLLQRTNIIICILQSMFLRKDSLGESLGEDLLELGDKFGKDLVKVGCCQSFLGQVKECIVRVSRRVEMVRFFPFQLSYFLEMGLEN